MGPSEENYNQQSLWITLYLCTEATLINHPCHQTSGHCKIKKEQNISMAYFLRGDVKGNGSEVDLLVRVDTRHHEKQT